MFLPPGQPYLPLRSSINSHARASRPPGGKRRDEADIGKFTDDNAQEEEEEAVAEDASIAYLDQFAQLDGSVPDLAATLTTQAEQDAEDANISFLRGEVPEEMERHFVPERSEESRHRRRRAVDAMLGGRRYTPEQMREMDESDDRALVAQNRARDYDGWAPGASDDEEEYSFEASQTPLPRLADDHALLRREESQNLRERMRNRLRRDYLEAQLDERSNSRRSSHLEAGEGEHLSRFEEHGRAGQPAATEASLRTTALLQAVRRNSQFSAHSRNQLQRFILDRERIGTEAEDRTAAQPPRGASLSTLSASQRRQINREATVLQETERQRMQNEYQRQLELLDQRAVPHLRGGADTPRSERRTPRYWSTQAEAAPKKSARSIDNAIKYLERLRLCESDQEGLETAEEGGFETEERTCQDFLIDTAFIPPPPESSWLRIGGVLSGTQKRCHRIILILSSDYATIIRTAHATLPISLANPPPDLRHHYRPYHLSRPQLSASRPFIHHLINQPIPKPPSTPLDRLQH